MNKEMVIKYEKDNLRDTRHGTRDKRLRTTTDTRKHCNFQFTWTQADSSENLCQNFKISNHKIF